jgi:hypothetical protein
MDEDNRKFILELLIVTSTTDFLTTYTLTTVCKHTSTYALRQLYQYLETRIKFAPIVGKAMLSKLIGHPIKYTHVINTLHTPNNTEQVFNGYNNIFSDEFIDNNYIAISHICLWIKGQTDSIEHIITMLDYSICAGKATVEYNKEIDMTYVHLPYPNRHNPIPLLPEKNGLDSVTFAVRRRINTIRDISSGTNNIYAALTSVEFVEVFKIAIEYVYVAKNIDLTDYDIVYDNNVNTYVRCNSLLRKNSDIILMERPKSRLDELIETLMNIDHLLHPPINAAMDDLINQ